MPKNFPKAASVPKPKKVSKGFHAQTLTGMHDYLSADMKYWDWMISIAERLTRAYGFGKIVTPVIEQSSLFSRTMGESSDVVQKEMFSFIDQGGDHVSLRPEFTASIARAYVEHGMVNLPQPVKLWTWGPCFRREKPQAGRYRQFFQFSFESLGSDLPVVDAELIVVAHGFLQELQLASTLHINSIGCPICRPGYYEVLQTFLKSRKKSLCADCQKRMVKNPLRVFDCKEKKCTETVAEAPQIVDHLDEPCRDHFVKVLEHLDEMEIPYTLNPRLVRGLDYYTKTVFEFTPTEDEDRRTGTLIAGGRYDGLVEMLGGRPTPACGFAIGFERNVIKMKEKGITPPEDTSFQPRIFLAQIGESARRRSLKLFEDLRKAGVQVAGELVKQGLKQQLSQASKLHVKFTLILGQKEVIDRTILLRDMENGSQEVINYQKIIPELMKRLEKGGSGPVENPVITDDPYERVSRRSKDDIVEDLGNDAALNNEDLDMHTEDKDEDEEEI